MGWLQARRENDGKTRTRVEASSPCGRSWAWDERGMKYTQGQNQDLEQRNKDTSKPWLEGFGQPGLPRGTELPSPYLGVSN